jgi:serine/threonine-protein kinase
MTTWFRFLCSLIVILFAANSIVSASPKQYQNADYQIQISYPPTWKVLEAYAGAIVAVYRPQDSPDDQFAENANVVTEDLSRFQTMTIDQYTEKGKEVLSKMFTNFSLVKNEPTTISGINARTLTFTATQGIFRLKFKQTSLIVNNRAYIITFVAEEKNFSRYEATGTNIINSFKLLSPKLPASL